ncbi:uncharacterized protein SCHCODRAFT_02309117 [Schizophyllum commune H4-8]|uniref:uncharacterized protein n=1 Tax=Schizophyllum commune (strain H4-8 / FGSC 9210) TaxID=578458 RepID=UPI00216106A5|nr:uncharacterized protein SCHCODRAFT_02309117 [Schizophyllum commune H4-8]KAI5891038.1 hypothetical protein SCHCODRAFT_02309117 [Schizophyllum commune H4-8]
MASRGVIHLRGRACSPRNHYVACPRPLLLLLILTHSLTSTPLLPPPATAGLRHLPPPVLSYHRYRLRTFSLRGFQGPETSSEDLIVFRSTRRVWMKAAREPLPPLSR